MARLSGIRTKLKKHGIDDKTAAAVIGNGELICVTERMTELLDAETVYAILDSSACGTSKRELDSIKALPGATLAERISGLRNSGDYHSEWDACLNPGGTVTAGWKLKGEDGYTYGCACTAAAAKGIPVKDLMREGLRMPLTYCRCCAGHCRTHLERLLGVSLVTAEVVSSPVESLGESPCVFTFNVK